MGTHNLNIILYVLQELGAKHEMGGTDFKWSAGNHCPPSGDGPDIRAFAVDRIPTVDLFAAEQSESPHRSDVCQYGENHRVPVVKKVSYARGAFCFFPTYEIFISVQSVT